MTRSTRPDHRRRGAGSLAALAMVATAGAMLPVFTSGTATAATSSCLAPTGLTPNAGTTATAPDIKEVTLGWTAPSDAAAGAVTYDLQVSANQDYTSNLAYSVTSTTTSFVLPVTAIPHGSYFWRVRVTGRTCWSDDGGTTSAEFTQGWDNGSTDQVQLSYPADDATIATADQRFSWQPMAHASSYLLEVADPAGHPLGDCVTQATSYSTYDVASSKVPAEKVTSNASCTLPVLTAGTYEWRVLPLDDTGVAIDGAAYQQGQIGYGTSGTPEAHDGAALNSITKAELGTASDIRTVTLQDAVGSATALGTVNVRASQVAADGSLGSPCDVAATGTSSTPSECATTPTLHWPAVAGAKSYHVVLSTDWRFTNVIREFDTAATSLTPIDELLDSQAGQAYFVNVCSDTGVCSPTDAPADIPSFRKRTAVLSGLSATTNGASGPDGTVQKTLSWTDPATAGQPEPSEFEVQVSNGCDYSTLTGDTTTDATKTVALYGPGTHFWRVRGIDASGNPGPWTEGNRDTAVCGSAPASFTVATPAAPAGSSTSPGSTGPSAQPGSSTSPGAPAAPAVTVDVTDKSVVKSGKWLTRKASGASRGSALVTDGTRKQALTYSFQRGQVTVSYCTGPMDGLMSVYVDGKLKRTINTYRKFTSCGTTYVVGSLSKTAKHKLLVQASDKRGVSRGGTQIVVDFVKIA